MADGDARLVERSDHGGETAGTAPQTDGDPSGPGGALAAESDKDAPRRLLTSRIGDLETQSRIADSLLECGGVAFSDDRATVDDRDTTGELIGFLEVLGGEEDRGAFVVERPDLLPHGLATRGVESGRRLIEEQHRWLVDQREGEIKTSTHASGVGTDPPIAGFGETDPFEEFPRPLLPWPTTEALHDRLKP